MELIILMSIIAAVLFALEARSLKQGVSDLEREVERIERERKEEEECLVQSGGLDEYNRRLQELKEKRKQKILVFLKEHGEASSGEVAELLDISRTTAFRYLQELVHEGSVSQKGESGRGVLYVTNVSNTV